MSSMAALLHLSRLRQALLSSARDAGEVLSKAFRADEASRVSQVVASFLDCPRTAPDGETAQPTASTANQGSSQVFIQSADIQTANYASERSKMATSTPSCEPPFEPSASASEGFAELRTTKNSSRTLDSRLEESEGWFLTDMISGCEEGSLHAQRIRNGTNSSGGSSVGSSSPSRDRGSMVMVSSVESLVSAEGDADDIDCLSSGGSSKDGEDNQSRIIAPISTSAGCSSVGEATKADAVEVAADLEQQTEQAIVPLLSELGRQYGDEAIYAISRKPAFGIKRFYMIEAGHGWSSYQSLEHLLRFLGETVKVFGAGHLRTTKFLLPVEEAEGFLDELQKIAPYSLKDFVSAAKAASSPVLFALAARFLFVQLTETALGWGAAAEIGAAAAVTGTGSVATAGAAAAAAGETAAATTGAASLYSACSTAVAFTPWVILVGGCVYGVFCFIHKLRNVRRKVLLCPTTEAGETELEDGLPQGAMRDHCIIRWGQATDEQSDLLK